MKLITLRHAGLTPCDDRRIVAGLLPERPGLGPGQVLVKFMPYNVALGRGFLRIVRLFVVSIITPCGP